MVPDVSKDRSAFIFRAKQFKRNVSLRHFLLINIFADHSDIYPRTLGLYFPISVRTFVRVLSGDDTVGGPILCPESDIAVARGRSN